jgi:putative acetyltransferase
MIFQQKKFVLKNKVEGVFCPAEKDDAQKILDIFFQIAMTTPYILSTPESVKQIKLEDEEKWIQNNNLEKTSILILAKVKSEIIGLTNFSAYKDEKRSHRGALGTSVHPDFRGLGLGSQMMNFLIENIKTMETIKSVELSAMSPNIQALQLYRNLGFKETGCVSNAYMLQNGQYADDISMQLWL